MIRSLTLLGVGVLTTIVLCARPAAADAVSSPFGINGCAWSHLGMNTPNFDRDAGLKRLAALKAAGVTWDRCDLWWGRIEPEKGKFVFDDVDWVVRQYRQAGIQLMPILCYGSAWQKSEAPVTDEERVLFARYVYEMVNRYKADVRVWEIWNEPNITPFWSPRPDPTDYAKLLKVAYEAAKKADPTCTVVGASTAGTDLAFIEALLLDGAGQWMDAISIHPYQGDLGSLSPDLGGLSQQIRGLRQMLADHGYALPIYITEMGHRTTGTHGHTEVTEAQQAAYVVRSFVLAQSAGVERLFWFNLQDWDEFWGIIRQDFSRKPSFEAYQTMTRHLEGKRPAGTLALGEHVAAHIFAPPGRLPTSRNSVLVVWRTDDADGSVRIGRREHRVGMMPTFITSLDAATLRQVTPLPEPPTPASRKRTELTPPGLPEMTHEWHIPDAARRFVVAAELHEPIRGASQPLRVPAAQIPPEFADVRLFSVFDRSDDGPVESGIAQRDLDGNVVILAIPAIPAARDFYLYPRVSSDEQVETSQGPLDNGLLLVEIPDGKYIRSIKLPNGYATRGDEVNGIFSASYQDTDGGWPRLEESVEVIETASLHGPVVHQHRSRVRFGRDRCEYEFTVTLFDGLPRVGYSGHWISGGTGASKQVNLGDSFPAGSVVAGMYGHATLPAAGAGYGPACVVRVSDHPTVTAVMVAPAGRLNTPGWATRSVVGAGLFYQTSFPARVSADYFWYEKIPDGELSAVAREHYLRCARPPAIAVGPVETQH